MEENNNDIGKLKAMIKENFEEQRKRISKLEAVTSFNGQQMLDLLTYILTQNIEN